MEPLRPEKIQEFISRVEERELAVALMQLVERWECPFCKAPDQLLFFPSPESIHRPALFSSHLYDESHSIPVLALNCGNCGFVSNFWPMPIIKRTVENLGRKAKSGGSHDSD